MIGFWSFYFPENYICYRRYFNLNFYNGKKCRKFSYGFKNLVKLEVENFFFKIPIGRTIFNFSCKTSRFCGAGCSFWYLFLLIFCHFFMQNFSFLGGWVVFLSKKRLFFHEKLRFLRGWMLFLVPFLTLFCHFFCLFRGF